MYTTACTGIDGNAGVCGAGVAIITVYWGICHFTCSRIAGVCGAGIKITMNYYQTTAASRWIAVVLVAGIAIIAGYRAADASPVLACIVHCTVIAIITGPTFRTILESF